MTSPRLLHHKLDPSSRLVRLMLSEYGIAAELEDTSPWKREPALLEINPAATVPILIVDGHPPVVGGLAAIHHVEDGLSPAATLGLVPLESAARAEMWRLLEWVMMKFNDEVTRYVLEEKIVKRDLRVPGPDVGTLRAAKANLNEHMNYFSWLLATRRWLGGEEMTLADFALAAHLSTLDYLGDVPWENWGEVKDWYARVKSRPAFRTLLGDRIVGHPPSPAYGNLDF